MGNKKTGKFLKCVICEKEFYVRKYRLDIAKTCSRKCHAKNLITRQSANCLICNKTFEFTAIRKDYAKYCSRKCFYKAMHLKGTVIKVCEFCNKEFNTSPSHKRKFCSTKCFAESCKKSKTGGFSFVRMALKRRGLINKCFDCGYDSVKEILGIHHNDMNRNNNSIENLIVLCPNCHSIRHRKHTPH